MIRHALITTLAFFATTSVALAGDFYQWVGPDGSLAVADDVKRIPEAYREMAIKRSFESLVTTAKLTRVVIPAAERRATLYAELDRLRARNENPSLHEEPTCNGPATVSQVRETYRERGNQYNSLFYVLRDSCGHVVSKTRENPIPVVKNLQ